MNLRAAVGIDRSVEHIRERLCKAAVEVRSGLMGAEQRWDIEAIGAEWRDGLADVGRIGTNLVRPIGEGKGSDVYEDPWSPLNIREQVGLRHCLAQLGTNHALVTEANANFWGRRWGEINQRDCPVRAAVTGRATDP